MIIALVRQCGRLYLCESPVMLYKGECALCDTRLGKTIGEVENCCNTIDEDVVEMLALCNGTTLPLKKLIVRTIQFDDKCDEDNDL